MSSLTVVIVGVNGEFGAAVASRLLARAVRVRGVDIADVSCRVDPQLEGYCYIKASASDGVPDWHALALSAQDVVVFATPSRETIDLLPLYASRMRPAALLAEISSTNKCGINALLTSLAQSHELESVSLHPLFRPDREWIGQNIVCIPVVEREMTDRLVSVMRSEGLRVLVQTAEQHDRKMAFFQSLVHTALSALGVVFESEGYRWGDWDTCGTALARDCAALIERVANMNSSLFAEIQIAGSDFGAILERFIVVVQQMREMARAHEQLNLEEVARRLKTATDPRQE